MTEAEVHRFRFAVTTRGETLTEWRDFARKAEDLGYSTLCIGEHVDRFFAVSGFGGSGTSDEPIRLGIHIVINDLRHPLVLAKEAATTDVMSEGRLELGIGTGSSLRDFQIAGLPIASVGTRVERLQEAVAILKAFFSQDSVSFKGKYFQVDAVRTYPRAIQRPHIPLMIGTSSERMLKFAAREADIISILTERSGGPSISGSMSEKVRILRQAGGWPGEKRTSHLVYAGAS
jgi:probable F420-dependent oxidoreductase